MIENGPKLVPNNALLKVTEEVISVGISATVYSTGWRLIDLSSFALEYQLSATGSPNVKIEFQQSSDGTNWYTPENVTDIDSTVNDENLHGIQLTSLITVQYFRLKVTELTGTVTDTVLTVKLSAQKKNEA